MFYPTDQTQQQAAQQYWKEDGPLMSQSDTLLRPPTPDDPPQPFKPRQMNQQLQGVPSRPVTNPGYHTTPQPMSIDYDIPGPQGATPENNLNEPTYALYQLYQGATVENGPNDPTHQVYAAKPPIIGGHWNTAEVRPCSPPAATDYHPIDG